MRLGRADGLAAVLLNFGGLKDLVGLLENLCGFYVVKL
jgi:hypothetical protein